MSLGGRVCCMVETQCIGPVVDHPEFDRNMHILKSSGKRAIFGLGTSLLFPTPRPCEKTIPPVPLSPGKVLLHVCLKILVGIRRYRHCNANTF